MTQYRTYRAVERHCGRELNGQDSDHDHFGGPREDRRPMAMMLAVAREQSIAERREKRLELVGGAK